jgi:hypothetical protein
LRTLIRAGLQAHGWPAPSQKRRGCIAIERSKEGRASPGSYGIEKAGRDPHRNPALITTPNRVLSPLAGPDATRKPRR